MSSPICWMNNNIFSDTSQQASKKYENWRAFFVKHRKTKQNAGRTGEERSQKKKV